MENDIDDAYNKAVAQILRERKEEMGISFDALAEQSGLPRTTVARVIYGSRDIKVYALRRIAAVLELSATDVLNEADTMVAK